MENFDQIRSLLAERGKQTPEPGYCERFLDEFRDRQRREAMTVPARRLIWERTETWMESRFTRRWLRWGGVGLALLGAGILVWRVALPEGNELATAGVLPLATNPGLEGFAGLEGESAAVNLMEPSLVRIGWTGQNGDFWTPGFQVADGMFVSAFSDAELLDSVQIRKSDELGRARIVLKDPNSGLVVIDARGLADSGAKPVNLGP